MSTSEFSGFADDAKKFADDHPEQTDQALNKVDSAINQDTGDKFSGEVNFAEQKAEGYLGTQGDQSQQQQQQQ